MNKIFEDFAEIEDDLKNSIPPLLYKYRDWNNDFHKKVLIDNLLWLTHPKDLNDPYDIRTPVTFDFNEIEHPLFFEKLKYFAEKQFPLVDTNSREFRVICENKFDEIKLNPNAYFEKNYKTVRESNIYDCVGVCSLSKTELDPTMWAHYALDSTGFCVGFDSVNLIKNFPIRISFGHVDYKSNPPLHSFIKEFDENQESEMFLKHTKWNNEDEFRFLTLDILKASDREIKFDGSTISEIILGKEISNQNEDEIISILKTKYYSKIKLFRIETNTSSFNYSKKKIIY